MSQEATDGGGGGEEEGEKGASEGKGKREEEGKGVGEEAAEPLELPPADGDLPTVDEPPSPEEMPTEGL